VKLLAVPLLVLCGCGSSTGGSPGGNSGGGPGPTNSGFDSGVDAGPKDLNDYCGGPHDAGTGADGGICTITVFGDKASGVGTVVLANCNSEYVAGSQPVEVVPPPDAGLFHFSSFTAGGDLDGGLGAITVYGSVVGVTVHATIGLVFELASYYDFPTGGFWADVDSTKSDPLLPPGACYASIITSRTAMASCPTEVQPPGSTCNLVHGSARAVLRPDPQSHVDAGTITLDLRF